jgi:hypothetical protein
MAPWSDSAMKHRKFWRTGPVCHRSWQRHSNPAKNKPSSFVTIRGEIMKQFTLAVANVDRYITVKWDDTIIYDGKADGNWQSAWETEEGEHQLEIRFGKRPKPSILDALPRGLFAEGYGKFKHIPIQLFAPYCQFHNGTYRTTVQIVTQKGEASLNLRLVLIAMLAPGASFLPNNAG